MKNLKITVLLLFALVALTACGSSETEVQEPGAVVEQGSEEGLPVAEDTDALTADYEDAIPVGSQLTVGTLALDETNYAVTADQVNDLLFYWNALLNMTTNETIAEDEVQALYAQIEAAMTSEQIQAIADMRLTNENMSEYMMAMSGGRGGDFEITDEMKATREAMMESGEVPEGLGGGGGGGIPGSGQGRGGLEGDLIGSEDLKEDGESKFSNQATEGLNPRLIQSVIDYLNGILE